MKNHLFPRILSLILAIAMVASFAVPVHAAGNQIHWNESNTPISLTDHERLAETHVEQETYAPTDVVRVSIVLEDQPTVQAGFSTMDIAQNPEAMAYSASLQEKQETMAQTISAQALGGVELDVVWNLTLVGNVISANVPYGKIAAIGNIAGVKAVVLERTYEPCVVSKEESAVPQMATSGSMIGSNLVWSNGYTGAGTRVAIIDTGTDTDHQSFDNGAFLHALKQNAAKAECSEEDYIQSLNLLDKEEIASVLTQLNAYERSPSLTADELFVSDKLAFGYNYKDNSLYITHDQDFQTEHGSHVAGISAANRYIPQDGGYVDALENVFVSGVAPDAQIITMKIFGISGGTTDADYMAAIEDAILLGCDSVNLSIGTTSAGEPYYDYYTELLNYMAETDTVVVASAGNAGRWADASIFGSPYNDDVPFDTHGTPGSLTNLLSVASVENSGSVGYGFKVGELNVTYNETGYNNAPMTTLDTSGDKSGTVYDYIFVDGTGQPSDYLDIDLTGKVVFCSRGYNSFYEKANLTASRGAAATIIYNNQSGVNNMDLTGYRYSAPCVSITQADAAAIRAVSTQQSTDAGLTYFTGQMTITGKMMASVHSSAYYTMSSFSSWGVPGNLSLKPEITAPGGMIYSVLGSTPGYSGSTQYVTMSGTSMAAPQITGMVALIAQYIRETGLDKTHNISARHLAQSLLMSTAVPLREEASGGNYYSLLNQGAGLGRVDLATAAESYIKVEGQDDYKVKAELGDDPDRTGIYQFSFSINNLTGKAQSYALSADTFSQDVYEYIEGSQVYLLDTWTANLPAVATFTAEGAAILEDGRLAAHDVNGDGQTDALDADFLLEYILGNETELKAEGDINGDGQVDSFDAHVLLALLEGKSTVTVPASGSVTIQVKLELTKEARERLDTWNPDGTYVEAFVYARAIADSEGTVGTTHSIPVLAFYGNWTDPNMFDRGTWVEMANGVSDNAPYLYQVIGNGNFLTVDYGDGNEYYFGGNPILPDSTFLPERNAFNNATDDVLVGQYFTLIRNASASRVLLTNKDTGEVYMDEELGEVGAAYYDPSAGNWYYTQQTVLLDWKGTDKEGTPLPEGTTVELTLIAAPAYYRTADGSYDYAALGKGAYLSTPITIDNTAPTASNIALDLLSGSKLTVTARDNQYVAAVALLNSTGTSILASGTPNQTEPNVEVNVELDITGVSGKTFQLAVYDYANNVTTYEVELGLQPAERPYFTVIDWDNWQYLGLDQQGNATVLADCTRGEPHAAEYVDGFVFEVTSGDSLYVADNDDLTNFIYIGELDAKGEYGIRRFLDLAYNVADGKLYGLFYADSNESVAPYFCTIDMFSGAMTVLAELPVDVMNLAIDDKGTCYSVAYYSPSIYTYTVADVTAENPTMTYRAEVSYFGSGNWSSLAWDHNTDKLYYAYPNALLEVDTETFQPTLVGDTWLMYRMCGLFIAPGSGGSIFDPTDKVSHVEIDYTEARTLVGHNYMLTARVRPWNVSDGSVIWSTSNANVATVDDKGLVVGVSEGTAIITATSTLDSTKSVSCTMKVEKLNKKLDGIVWDEEGEVWFSQFDVNNPAGYTKLTEKPCDVGLASTAIMPDGKLYAASVDTTTGALRSRLYSVDPKTFQTTEIGLSTDGYSDLAPAPHLDGGAIAATYGGNFLLVDPTTGDYQEDWIFYMFGYNLVGIAYAGSTPYVDIPNGFDTHVDWYFLVDTEGYIYMLGWLENIYGEPFYLEHPSTNAGIFTVVNVQTDTPYFSSLYYSGDFLYYSSFNSNRDVSTLYAIDTLNNRKAYNLGNFGTGVWPMGGLMELSDLEQHSALLEMEITAQPTALSEAGAIGTLGAESKTHSAKLNSAPVGGMLETDILRPQSSGAHNPETNEVTVEITAAESATNGRLTVSYDASLLTLKTVTGKTEAFAYTTGEGAVELAYAAKTALSGDAVVATLTFTLGEITKEETSLTLSYTQLNDSPSDQTETITVALPHQYESVVTEPTCTEGGYTTYTCTLCGHSYVDNHTEAKGHTWGDWTVTTPATCTDKGAEKRTCSVCGETETREVEATGHNYGDWTVSKATTCTEDGTETRLCACGASETRTVPATGHSFGDWTVTTPATCTTKGVETRTCAGCGQTETRETESFGHDWSDWTVAKAPTCTEDGEENRTCATCGETEKRATDALGHHCTAVTVSATCTTDGYTEYTCTVCGYSYRDNVVAATGHNYEATITAPTCTSQGYTTYTCTACGDTYITDYVDAAGHTFGEWTVTKAATCTEAGTETRTCDCGQTEERAIPATGHSFGDWTVTTPATCTEKGEESRTCATCGETQTRNTDALGHNYTAQVIEPTCTDNGYTLHTCDRCGHSYITDLVEILDHDYEKTVTEPTCTDYGYTTYTCTVCGDNYATDYVSATGHSYGDWVVTLQPQCFTKGEEKRTCHCGETETRAIPASGEHCPSKGYHDLKADQWYHESVDYVLRAGLMEGMDEETFAPNANMTRAQLVTVLYRLAGSPEVTEVSAFTDVAENAWYHDAVVWAYTNEITTGTTQTTFAPNTSVTREQMVAFFARYAQLCGQDLTVSGDLSDFTDAHTVSDYAREYMLWAVQSGLIQGMDDDTIAPKATTTRAQVAAVLMRYCQTFG